MRNNKFKILLKIILIALIISTSSCRNNNSKDSKDAAEKHKVITLDETVKETDAQFLISAAEMNEEAIRLGQLAQQKNNVDHVKELGKMMEVGHTKSLAELTVLAQTKKISLPTSQFEKEAYKKLNKKSGNDFGKEYSGFMVNEHKDAIVLFEKAATTTKDPEIRAWANATLPVLRRHLDLSLICQKKCEKLQSSLKN